MPTTGQFTGIDPRLGFFDFAPSSILRRSRGMNTTIIIRLAIVIAVAVINAMVSAEYLCTHAADVAVAIRS
jgi:hypothetical protein